jgi:murein DD-endopeptidase MepM/ murein hydrolase activator NlpD
MGLGAGGAILAGGLAVAARGPAGGSHPATTGAAAPATPTVVVAHGTPPPMLALRPRLAEGSVLATLALPGSAQPLTVLEGTPAQPGMIGHDTATAYPGEPHSMLLIAGPGVSPAAPPAGSSITVTAGYGVYRYQVTDTRVERSGNAPAPQVPGLRLLVALPGATRVTTAQLLAADPETRAVLAEETAVAEAQAALSSQPSGVYNTTSGHLLWPCSGPITQGFGPTTYAFEFPYVYRGVEYPHFHTGVDIGVATGTPVGAAAGGVVVLAGTNVVDGRLVGYGTYVVIAHGGGLYTLYAHLSQLSVVAGERVRAGQAIGLSGSTGNSTGPHLHFEVRDGDEPVDPMPYL